VYECVRGCESVQMRVCMYVCIYLCRCVYMVFQKNKHFEFFATVHGFKI